MRLTAGRVLFAVTAVVMCATGASSRGVAAVNSSRSAAVTSRAPTAAARASVVSANPIRHVIVIYQENHSFDETLGKFCELHHRRCDGYTGTVRLKNGAVVAMHQSRDIVPNVFHNVKAQVTAVDGGKMDGWSKVGFCSKKKHFACLTYYVPSQIPSLAALASKFVVADRTFSMANSPSWGGHLYVAAATLDNFTGELPTPARGFARGPGWGCNSNLQAPWISPKTHTVSMQPSCIPARPGTLDPKRYPFNGAMRGTRVSWVPTIFDRLDAKHISWKLYSSTAVWAVCPSFAECLYGPQHDNVVATTRILRDAAHGTLPSFSVLLPEGGKRTDQHNGNSMLVGDNWIGRAVSAIESGPDWSSTAVFITYDDCGCFYDHVPPGKNPDGTPQGVRVPMVIVSPYAKAAYTDHHQATFASILKFTEETFGLAPLSVNDRKAYDYSASFDFNAAPTGSRTTLGQHRVPAASLRYLAAHPLDLDDPT